MGKEGKKRRVGESTISDVMPEVVFMYGKRTEDSNGWKDKEYVTFKDLEGHSSEYKKTKILQLFGGLRPFHPYVIQSDIEGIHTISNCFETYFFVKPNKFFSFLNHDINTLYCLNETVRRDDLPFWVERIKPIASYLQRFCSDALIKHGDITSPDILFHFTKSIAFCEMGQRKILKLGGTDQDQQYKTYSELKMTYTDRNKAVLGKFGYGYEKGKIVGLGGNKTNLTRLEFYEMIDQYSPIPF